MKIFSYIEFTLIIILLVFKLEFLNCQTSSARENEYRYFEKKERSDCGEQIETESEFINIGSIFAGTTVDNLPTSDGNSNEMIFIVHGKKKSNIYITTSFSKNLLLDNGYLTINSWSWEILDKTSGGAYGNGVNSDNLSGYKIELIENGDEQNCKSYAKIKLKLNSVTVSSNASPGTCLLYVNFQLTSVEY